MKIINVLVLAMFWIGIGCDQKVQTVKTIEQAGRSSADEKVEAEPTTDNESGASSTNTQTSVETNGKVKEIGWKDLRSFDMKSRTFKDPEQKAKVLDHVVKIPGYIAPFDEEGIEFMVVPYLQPCFHVPAPPPNQMIYVKLKEPSPVKFGAVWLQAKIQPAAAKKDMPEVGFEAVTPVKITKFE